MPGEVARLIKTQRNAEGRGTDTTGLSKGKDVEQRMEDVQLGPTGRPLPHPFHYNAEVEYEPQQNSRPTESVDEEEVNLAKAMALSLSHEAQGE